MNENAAASWDARIVHSSENGTICVRFHDKKIVDTAQIEAMSEELSRLTSNDGSRMVLNLDGVEFLSSAALNKLVSLERKMKARDGTLALCSLTTTVRDVFSITRLGDLFNIHESEQAALASMT